MLVERRTYTERIMLFQDTDLVKVVTGIRRCGKSSLLQLVQNMLLSKGKHPDQIAAVNLESRKVQISDDRGLYGYFKSRANKLDDRLYIFIDEIQRIKGWHDVVNALRVDLDCDIYVTGSNAFLLSSDIATYLSGRYVEVNVLPLAFCEYLDFCGVAFEDGSDAAIALDGQLVTFDNIFERYTHFGGMPALASLKTTQEQQFQYMKSLYDTIMVRDILDRERHASERRISDPDLLRRIADYLADNIGNLLSMNRIAHALVANGEKVSDKTVAAYVKTLQDAYLFYECRRFDLRGKGLLKVNPKTYLSDIGLRRWLLNGRSYDKGRVFENLVYLQLLYEGYTVDVGKLYEKEIDFVAMREDERLYIQVADNIYDEDTLKRELAPLESIRDSYPKRLIVRAGAASQVINGIRVVSARDFFVDRQLL